MTDFSVSCKIFCLPPSKYLNDEDNVIVPQYKANCDQLLLTNSRKVHVWIANCTLTQIGEIDKEKLRTGRYKLSEEYHFHSQSRLGQLHVELHLRERNNRENEQI
ncbi:hypothetical protein chiPu_0018756 [Chiloscyllium punctatum]|uniref:Uncharacterized protein n=1 Tax=Chiloscyllium punctatum TaxID=137246 RepID=A0A401RPQ5_CHIPU|nr:hypothetical protein [Chiloscyllium punctatum]